MDGRYTDELDDRYEAILIAWEHPEHIANRDVNDDVELFDEFDFASGRNVYAHAAANFQKDRDELLCAMKAALGRLLETAQSPSKSERMDLKSIKAWPAYEAYRDCIARRARNVASWILSIEPGFSFPNVNNDKLRLACHRLYSSGEKTRSFRLAGRYVSDCFHLIQNPPLQNEQIVNSGVEIETHEKVETIEQLPIANATELVVQQLNTGGVRLTLGNELCECRNSGGELLAAALEYSSAGGLKWNEMPMRLRTKSPSGQAAQKQAVKRALEKAPVAIRGRFKITKWGIEISGAVDYRKI